MICGLPNRSVNSWSSRVVNGSVVPSSIWADHHTSRRWNIR